MADRYVQIKKCIEEALDKGKRDFIIYPFGGFGLQVKNILNTIYGIQEAFVVDGNLCRYNPEIKSPDFLGEIDCSKYVLFLASDNPDVYEVLKGNAMKYFGEESILELEKINKSSSGGGGEPQWPTKIGKHSDGPLARTGHRLIESIGAFCSFAYGVEATDNHPIRFITTHPILYAGQIHVSSPVDYMELDDMYGHDRFYIPGIRPRRELLEKDPKIRIGNDVWLGRNVIITNGANIGNGVIAGAGAVITKDVPDYAVVVGVPARIMRYRYTPEQVAALNRIKWWDWPDDIIRDRLDDFYAPIEEFIGKYDVK